MFGRSRFHDNLCSVVHCCPPHCFLVLFFLRPPAAQERQGAVLVLTSPLVTLTSHYQIQLVPGPAPLLKQRVPLSPHTLHPLYPPPSLCSWSPLPVYSLAPGRHVCTMEIKQREGEKKEGEWQSITVHNLCCCSLLLISPPLPLLSLLVQRSLWQGVSHSDLFGLRKTGSQLTFAGYTERQRDELRDRG